MIAFLLPIPLANRFVGMGKVSRLISLPIACIIIGICLALATPHGRYYALIAALLFAVGRGPSVANGLNCVNNEPIRPERDGWDTKWFSWICHGDPHAWAIFRIAIFYLPFFEFISYRYGVFASMSYALCWMLCYSAVKPLWNVMGWTVTENCYTSAAEWAECVLFAIILGFMVY